MLKYNKNRLPEVLDKLSNNIGESGSRIIFINGKFGIGKTYFVDMIDQGIVAEGKFDGIFKYNSTQDVKFLPEFTNAVFNGFININDENKYHTSETLYNIDRFKGIVKSIRASSPQLFDYIRDSLSLMNKFDFYWKAKHLRYANDDIISKIREIIKVNSDQILLENPGRICAESFVVDLITSYLPVNDKPEFEAFLQHGEKIKIAIIIDNYDSISGSIDEWLANDFIDACTDMKISDFTYFDNPQIASNLQVKEILDIRFVISGRFPSGYENNDLLNKFKEESILISLKEVDSDMIVNYLQINGLNPDEYLHDFESISGGNPFIMSLLMETIKIGSNNYDMMRIYHLVEERIFRGRSDEQRDWIRCAAFLDVFDSWGLRVFPSMAENYKKAHEFFLKSDDLAHQVKNSDKITLHQQIKEFIRGSIKFQSETLFNEYTKLRNKYHSFSELIDKYDKNECNILRNLAYFKRFDLDFMIRKAFFDKAENTMKVIEKNKKLFDKMEFTLRMKPDVATEFIEFNKVVDNVRFEEKSEIVKEIYFLIKENIKNEKLEKNKNIENIENQLVKYRDESEVNKKRFKDIQLQLIKIENDLIEKSKILTDSGQGKNKRLVISLMATSIVFFLSGIFADNIFEDVFKNTSTTNLVRIILLSMSGIAVVTGAYYFIKGMVFGRRKNEYENALNGIEKIKGVKIELADDMESVKSNFEIVDKNIEELSARKDMIVKEIESLIRKEKEISN